ncbi:ANTAR domain-containing response regulator [Desulfitobacterium sp.]|uniref:ANTAR domain-containing response regulator n=1 Tax=Desulfitobacterium sp. TaxID=49981 RepID=UPI002B1EC42F|nr:ANTAR domain-containing protein [Desulfitobacterium sp.]MEA4902876.1 ANTAR domain-containing protein [Desulfitobacterium sp.]
MDSVLVVSSTDKGQDFLSEFLRAHDFSKIATVKSGGEARRLLNDNDFELVVINAPLRDESGEELSLMVTDISMAGVILIVKSESADDVSAKVEDYGVFVLPKPFSRSMFFQALKLMAAARRRLLGLQHENVQLLQKIEDIRLVDRAKCTLIQYLNLTEPQAHRYIEKQAMDRRISKRKVAQGILNTYEC